MKLLRITATGYKNCCDNFTIDLTAHAKKSAEDKEYELKEIAEGLYVFNTLAIIGKNASGKTSAVELLAACYAILSRFQLENTHYNYDNVSLELIFYHEKFIYRYTTVLKAEASLADKVAFTHQHLYRKKYYKTKAKDIYALTGYEELKNPGELPEDTSALFFILKKKAARAVYFDCNGDGIDSYRALFHAMKTYHITANVLSKIIRLFDAEIQSLEAIDEKRYRLRMRNTVKELSDSELIYFLSSGTTKGLLLYIYLVAALQNGFDLLIDEIENHFHKTLVENMISLFKDSSVNKQAATLIFTTHYCELLDLFNRQDNIWITKAQDKITVQNMYNAYNIRPELLKSRQFYNNAFDTAVNYEDLMALKQELMK